MTLNFFAKRDGAEKATVILFALNFFLFFVKIFFGLISGSIAVLSDSFNSLTDCIVSVIILFSVKLAKKKADAGHPFGHHRAEPIAALMVAIFTAVVGFEIFKFAVEKILSNEFNPIGPIALLAVIITFLTKAGLFFYLTKTGKKHKSPALLASAVDARNDVLISITIFIGLIGAFSGFLILDAIAAILVSFYIVKSGFGIAKSNLTYLMGEAPTGEINASIRKAALSVKGIKAVHDVKAHYIGTKLQVEVHIEVDKKLTLQKAHDLSKEVKKAVEGIDDISNCFVHIDPI